MTSLNTLNISMLTYELKKAKLDSIKRKSLFFWLIAQQKADLSKHCIKINKAVLKSPVLQYYYSCNN